MSRHELDVLKLSSLGATRTTGPEQCKAGRSQRRSTSRFFLKKRKRRKAESVMAHVAAYRISHGGQAGDKAVDHP